MNIRTSFQRILAIAAKEVIHLKRDRVTGGMIAGIPIVLTLLFGYAINNEVRNLSAAVVDQSNTSASRALVAAAEASQVISITKHTDSVEELQVLLASNKISVGLYIPSDFEQRLLHETRPLAQMLVNGSDPIVLATARALYRMPFSTSKHRAAMQQTSTFEVRTLYNPERRSPVFIVPGLIGVILTLTMVLFTSIAIVRERERGNMELLITTPVSSLELMIGKIVPYILIGYVQASLILLLGIFLFDLPFRGSMLDFYAGVGIFVISALTLGLFISTLASSQFQAFQMTFMSFLPQLLLSGYMFPFEGMPRAAQLFAETFPLTHFLRITRGIILRDASLSQMQEEIWPLALFFILMMTLATLRFRKSLD